MNRKQRIIISVTGIFIVLLILVGLTYAYFLTRISGNTNTKSISVTTADLKLTYGDGSDGVIGGEKLIPSETEYTKIFTVTNEGNANVEYGVYLIDVINTFSRKDDVKYTLNCTTNGTLACNKVTTETTFPSGIAQLITNEIEPGKTHTYTFTFTYKDTGTDQSIDMGKELTAKLQIFGKQGNGEYFPYSENTMAYTIINNAKNKTNGTELLETPKTKVAQEISASDEKVLSLANDDYGTSYYYRGGVEDNYVDFAGMCWRIVRIQGDGSIKLILEDQDSTCANNDGNWNIPTTTGGSTKIGNFGYTEYAANTLTASDGTQNSSAKYIMNYLNGGTNNDKSMATAFENFQKGPLANYLDKLKPGDWCLNDKAYATATDNATPLTNQEILDKQIKGTTFYYDSHVRLYGKTIKEPTLKCNGTVMTKFNDNESMYVGTLTVDEIVYAGGKVYISNPDYYLLNDYQKNNSLYFWSLSPYSFGNSLDSNHDFAFYVGDYGYIYDREVTNDASIRPAVSLKSSVQITGGNGTKANAYTIAD